MLIVRSLEGDPIEDLAIRVVETWKLGSAERDDGLLLLVALDDRQMRIEVGYGLEGAIPDALADRVIRNVLVPHFRGGDYAGGITAALDVLMRAAAGESVSVPVRSPRGAGRPNLAAMLVLLAAVVLLLYFVPSQLRAHPLRRGRRHPGWIGPVRGSGWGGGGSGGGGFAGGGGGFGGGGASGRW